MLNTTPIKFNQQKWTNLTSYSKFTNPHSSIIPVPTVMFTSNSNKTPNKNTPNKSCIETETKLITQNEINQARKRGRLDMGEHSNKDVVFNEYDRSNSHYTNWICTAFVQQEHRIEVNHKYKNNILQSVTRNKREWKNEKLSEYLIKKSNVKMKASRSAEIYETVKSIDDKSATGSQEFDENGNRLIRYLIKIPGQHETIRNKDDNKNKAKVLDTSQVNENIFYNKESRNQRVNKEDSHNKSINDKYSSHNQSKYSDLAEQNTKTKQMKNNTQKLWNNSQHSTLQFKTNSKNLLFSSLNGNTSEDTTTLINKTITQTPNKIEFIENWDSCLLFPNQEVKKAKSISGGKVDLKSRLDFYGFIRKNKWRDVIKIQMFYKKYYSKRIDKYIQIQATYRRHWAQKTLQKQLKMHNDIIVACPAMEAILKQLKRKWNKNVLHILKEGKYISKVKRKKSIIETDNIDICTGGNIYYKEQYEKLWEDYNKLRYQLKGFDEASYIQRDWDINDDVNESIKYPESNRDTNTNGSKQHLYRSKKPNKCNYTDKDEYSEEEYNDENKFKFHDDKVTIKTENQFTWQSRKGNWWKIPITKFKKTSAKITIFPEGKSQMLAESTRRNKYAEYFVRHNVEYQSIKFQILSKEDQRLVSNEPLWSRINNESHVEVKNNIDKVNYFSKVILPVKLNDIITSHVKIETLPMILKEIEDKDQINILNKRNNIVLSTVKTNDRRILKYYFDKLKRNVLIKGINDYYRKKYNLDNIDNERETTLKKTRWKSKLPLNQKLDFSDEPTSQSKINQLYTEGDKLCTISFGSNEEEDSKIRNLSRNFFTWNQERQFSLSYVKILPYQISHRHYLSSHTHRNFNSSFRSCKDSPHTKSHKFPITINSWNKKLNSSMNCEGHRSCYFPTKDVKWRVLSKLYTHYYWRKSFNRWKDLFDIVHNTNAIHLFSFNSVILEGPSFTSNVKNILTNWFLRKYLKHWRQIVKIKVKRNEALKNSVLNKTPSNVQFMNSHLSNSWSQWTTPVKRLDFSDMSSKNMNTNVINIKYVRNKGSSSRKSRLDNSLTSNSAVSHDGSSTKSYKGMKIVHKIIINKQVLPASMDNSISSGISTSSNNILLLKFRKMNEIYCNNLLRICFNSWRESSAAIKRVHSRNWIRLLSKAAINRASLKSSEQISNCNQHLYLQQYFDSWRFIVKSIVLRNEMLSHRKRMNVNKNKRHKNIGKRPLKA